MRDLDVADINGDGKKEIIAATSSGFVVALDSKCQKLWAKRLPSPPTVCSAWHFDAVVKVPGTAPAGTAPAGTAPAIVVGCEDGTVLLLDGKGQVTHMGKVEGRPTCIESSSPPVVGLATEKGEVKAFTVGD
jgi:hypothetical protein